MLIYVLLVVLFFTLFGFIAWRILMYQAAERRSSKEVYVCPVCDDYHCRCHKSRNADR